MPLEQQELPLAITEPSATGSPDATLLVVDDHEGNRRSLAELLRLEGYHVTHTGDGRQALQLLRRGRFDLVLLDIVMHGVSGMDVLRDLRADHSATELPVIMTTGLGQSEDIVCALELGANDYLTKPLDLPVLLARVRTQLSLKRAVEQIVRLEEDLSRRNGELEIANARMRSDLELAARVQSAFLPQGPPPVPGVRCAWIFRPCDELAGDMLNVFRLGEHSVGFYLLDVSGHGVAASLLAVALSRILDPTPGPTSLLVRPADHGLRLVPPTEVAAELNERFAWDPVAQQFFTMVYGTLDTLTGECNYVCAGHPTPIRLPQEGPPEPLHSSGLPIGVGPTAFQQHTLRLNPGDRLVLYSDGVIEAGDAGSAQFGRPRLNSALECGRGAPLAECLEKVWEEVRLWGTSPLADDVSLLALEYAP